MTTDCWATFHGNGGFPIQNTYAKSRLTIGVKYKVINCTIGGWETSLNLDGIDGSFNSVMFDIEGNLPCKFNYYSTIVKQ
jgi:hypothetical protein